MAPINQIPKATDSIDRRGWLAGGAIVALTLLAYLPLIHAGFIWDDNYYVTKNTALQSGEGLVRIWFAPRDVVPQYYPMTVTTFWMEYQMWGLRPLGFHIVNVLLHAGSAVVLWRLLRRLGVPGCWMAAAIFAVHPVHVESVAWITERKNILSGFFYLLALSAYLRYALPRATELLAGRRWYFVSLLLFVLALFSKTVTSSLPAAVLLILYWKRGKIVLKDVVPLVPFFVAGIAMGSITSWMERHIVGADGPEWQFTLAQRILIAGRALWFYVGKLAWPDGLCFIYPRWVVDPHSPRLILFPALAAASVIALWLLRRRLGRGPVVAVLFFAGTLFPALGFVNVYPMRFSFVADHFQYLASIGLIVLAVGVVGHLLRRFAPDRPRAGAILGGVVLASLMATTFARVPAFTSLETLWTDTLATNPDCWMAHNNMGIVYFERNDLDDAMKQYTAALELMPRYIEAGINLATAESAAGRQPEAIRQAQATLGYIGPDDSPVNLTNRSRCWYAIGVAYLRESDAQEADTAFENVVANDPKNTYAHIALAELMQNRGDSAGATKEWEIVTDLKPDNAKAHAMLANLYYASGRIDLAKQEYSSAIAADPDIFNEINRSNQASAPRGQ